MRKLLCAAALAVGASVVAQSAQAGTTYAIDLRSSTTTNRLIVFPSNAPALNVVAPAGNFRGFAMDFDAAGNTLYGITTNAAVAPPFQFGTINQTTGNFTSIATVTGAGAAETNWGDLIVAPDGTFYASASTGAAAPFANKLYRIDPVTGVTVLQTTFANTAGLFIDYGVDRNGVWYANDIISDHLFRVDPVTGAGTDLGPTGQATNFAQGMDFDWDTNTLYATLYTGGGTGVYASMNLTTGAATVLASTTTWNAEMEMAVKAGIPEPSSLSLLALAGAGVLRRRRLGA